MTYAHIKRADNHSTAMQHVVALVKRRRDRVKTDWHYLLVTGRSFTATDDESGGGGGGDNDILLLK